MDYTLAELQADIREIVNYNLSDEEHDYEVQLEEGNDEGAEHHIVHTLHRLETFTGGNR